MNAFDREFWNGSLKTAALIEEEIKKLVDSCSDDGLLMALKRVTQIKESIESLNSISIRTTLREIRGDIF